MRLSATFEQLDRHALRRTNKADAHAGPHCGRLLGELDAFVLEVGGDGIDVGNAKAKWSRPRCVIMGAALVPSRP
jgi:hypothetical protein